MVFRLQVVIHSVLASRILFHLRSSHDRVFEVPNAEMALSKSGPMCFRQPPQMQTGDTGLISDAV